MSAWTRGRKWFAYRCGPILALFPLVACAAPRVEAHTRADGTTLASAAAKTGRLFGTEVEATLLRRDVTYAASVRREFSVVVAQNEMKFGSLSRARGEYDFTDADAIARFATDAGLRMRGHTLAWHRNVPKWVSGGGFTGDQLAQILSEHIATVVGHFRAQFPRLVFAWDVVNEAIGKDGKPRPESIWARIGPTPSAYVALAFRKAHEADPRAELFYNDYGIEEINAKSDAVLALVRSLRAEGAPIDGVGFQFHLDVDDRTDFVSVARNFERFAALGLKIHITELDVALRASDATDAAMLDRQAQVYRSVARACVATPACEAMLSWGFTDAHSWIPSAFEGRGAALYFDDRDRPKPAYGALLDGLGAR